MPIERPSVYHGNIIEAGGGFIDMDRSGKYIMMCSKANELQALRPVLHTFYEGDYFASRDYQRRWYVTLATPNGKRRHRSIYFKTKKDSVWLPSQDQLQTMFGHRSAIELLDGLYGLVREYTQEDIDYYEQFTTMEQLWLGFVMKERYEAIWNGRQWLRR